MKLFSARDRKTCNEIVFDEITPGLRIQIKYLIEEFISENELQRYFEVHYWSKIQRMLKADHQKPYLICEDNFGTGYGASFQSDVLAYLMKEISIGFVLFTIELIFYVIQNLTDQAEKQRMSPLAYPAREFVDRLNKRFLENCVGYRFEEGDIIRIDNELLYNEITKPVFQLLLNVDYQAINEEYLHAQVAFRNLDYKTAIVDCGKAFESTMKIICDKKEYPYNQKDTVSKLINHLYSN